MNFKLFILDDDASFATELQLFLKRESYRTAWAGTITDARAQLPAFQPDILLLDMNLPDGNGIDFLPFALETLPDVSVVVLSGYGTIPAAVEAIKKGAEDFLTKPIDPEYLKLILNRLIERRRLRNRMILQDMESGSKQEFVIGSNAVMQELISTCHTAAKSDAIILIRGETGTGKQLLAHYIHSRSSRNRGPFVYVNCATLSETLLESDLFGHERGAFTGAHKMKRGRIELAHGGTLFLDEIAEMPLAVQAKLLHFIEYGSFQRVGGTTTLQGDVRAICATNKDLNRLITQGKFREDLFYRIQIIPVEIPPLRKRCEDICLFLDYFLDKFSGEMKKRRPYLTETVKRKLQHYPWPGNVRELQNAIERAVILSQKNYLSKKDFPFLVEPPESAETNLFTPRPLKQAMNEFKQDFIRRVLSYTGGNQTRAASILQIQRTYLNRLTKNQN